SSPTSSRNASSESLVSCRQTTSGCRSSSQGSSRGTRCLSEFTFQVAIRMPSGYAGSDLDRRAEEDGALAGQLEVVDRVRGDVLGGEEEPLAPCGHGRRVAGNDLDL